jgi:two-component system cell cycle response regulator DivK
MRQAMVLYVEDNEYNRKIVRHLLSRTSYRLQEAADGEAAIGMVRRERPDLILMDVQLPKMSGLEVTRALRGNPATADVPIIVVTSFALSGDDRRAMEAGASAYIAKPYSPRELLALIHKFLPDEPTSKESPA